MHLRIALPKFRRGEVFFRDHPAAAPSACLTMQPPIPRPAHLEVHGDTEHRSPPKIATDKEALDGVAQGFTTLLRADLGQAIGVPIDSVTVVKVAPGKESLAGWNMWQQWMDESLNVSGGMRHERW